MDIRKFAVEPEVRFQVKDANEVEIEGAYITVYGVGSKPYAKAQSAQQNRLMNVLKRKGSVEQSQEQKAAETANFLADCTKSFEGIEYDSKTGRELFVAVYSDLSIGFIADQVAKQIGDWSNFSKPSATN